MAIHEILIYASGVMSTVIDSVVYLPFQTMFPESFSESVHALHGESEVSLRCSGDAYMGILGTTLGSLGYTQEYHFRGMA